VKTLSTERLMRLYRRVIRETGGLAGVRDVGAVDAALIQPLMTFDGEPFYPTIAEKAAALGYALIKNHPFVDGNKRIGFAAMAASLRLNGQQVLGDLDEWEEAILRLAAGNLTREAFTAWLRDHIAPRGGRPA